MQSPLLEDGLMDGEALRHAGSVPALVYHRHGRDPSAPLMIFVPGGGHLARVAYGYPGGAPPDFLDHWLAAAGYGLLAASIPAGRPIAAHGHPGLTRNEWGEALAALAEDGLAQSNGRRSVVILAWSMAGGVIGHLTIALRARGIAVECVMPFSASSPLPRPVGSHGVAECLDEQGLWDVAGSTVFGIERRVIWNDELRAIEASLGRSVLSAANYQRHMLTGTPVGLLRGGFARAARPKDDPDIAAFPLAAPIIPTGQRDYRHALGDGAAWAYMNTQLILDRYEKAIAATGARLTEAAWQRLSALVGALPTRLAARVPGGHFFFVGESGARATAAAIDDLLAQSRAILAALNELIAARDDSPQERNTSR
ncbi:hypothetical protein [Dongia sedimenti]|uniref:Alpha/beta hydrolase n=1 Tax=Dongia sedimenti TaxID=3064282 RepID=A0ABU0YV20_9PROT|nr:hypothetical protein [Rhodospirillaceae bacterium R-7]